MMVTSNKTTVLQCFLKKRLRAFLDTKSSGTLSRSIVSKKKYRTAIKLICLFKRPDTFADLPLP